MAPQPYDDTRKLFTEILTAAGYGDAELTPVSDDYCPDGHRGSWYKFPTHLGDIVIGKCQQGIKIDWLDTCQDLHLLFCSEDTPKGQYFIHAPDKEKAIDYLMRVWLVFFRRERR